MNAPNKVENLQKIEHWVESHKVFLFMKGSPAAPGDRASQRAVELLLKCGMSDVSYCDVSQDPELRQSLSVWSGWPSVPQLFVQGVFIGGSDMMLELDEDGELSGILE